MKNRSLNTTLKKRIKVLFVSHASNLCGSERSLFFLMEGLDRNKYEALVLLPYEGPLKNNIEHLGIKVIVYPIKRWIPFDFEFGIKHFIKLLVGFPKRIRFLCKLIELEKINLVYTNSITVIDGAIAAKIKRLPHICHIHNILTNNTVLKRYLPISLISVLINILSMQIIVVSKTLKQIYKFKENGKYNPKVNVVYNGIDIGKFSLKNSIKGEKDLRLELGIGKDIKLIGLIGTFTEHKGQSEFIEAAKVVTNYSQKVAFILIGNRHKNFLDKLIAKTKALELNDKVHFLDFRENLLPLYQAIDILVSASWIESGPRTLIEAMAISKPVVATRCGGPEEIVVDGKTGFLVPVKSPKDLANAIIKLISNPNLAKEMGEVGHQRAVKLFSLEKYVSDVENIIDDVVERS